jgi:nucleotidyltransferase AbiEii toxin of type IV toxin-antitoxin system
MTIHLETISAEQQEAIRLLAPLLTGRQIYLAGGTSVALQLGHRRSVDLDWFSGQPIVDPMALARDLKSAKIPFETGSVGRGTLHGQVLGVRVSLLEFGYPLLRPPSVWSEMNCRLASLLDLAAMKLVAIAQRGSKKDFIDIHALGLQRFSLAQMLEAYQEKYGVDDVARILCSLTYFEDAEQEPTPMLLGDFSWDDCKETIRGWVKRESV